MLLFYPAEDRSAWFSLAFAGAYVFGSIYGLRQARGRFGLVEAVWAMAAVSR
jgi:hypothetical protein